MSPHLSIDALREVATHADMPTLLCLGRCSRGVHSVAARAAEDKLWSGFVGVRPLQPAAAARQPFWRSLRNVLRPTTMLLKYGGEDLPSDCTNLLKMVLDTEGPWFVELEVTAAMAESGSLSVGLVDATAPLAAEEWRSLRAPRDLSRKASGKLAISFCAQSGRMFACGLEQLGAQHRSVPANSCRSASLRWETVGDASERENGPISVGFLIESRSLTLFRDECTPQGFWHSSGAVLENLPKHVVPAAFMSSFVGYANVNFVKLWTSAPRVCNHREMTIRGFARCWSSWPFGG